MSRSIRAVFVFALAACLGSAVIAESPARAPKGRLLIIGGNGTTDDIVKRAVEAGGGANGRVAIFPQASELAETGPAAVKTWTAAGLGTAVVVDPKDPAACETVRGATFIWFPGGDQNRLTKALENTGIPEAIRVRYEEGALVGGTSAGAAVMSQFMMTGEADLQSITAGRTETAPGLALFPDVIVDQHFLKRQRANRLISAVLDHPELVGIGIDETTAILVTGRTIEVLGKSSVVVIDARKAAVDKTPAGQLATGRNLALTVLKAGMTYRLDGR
jgi:cyanophycinase